MSILRGDATEFYQFAADLSKVGAGAVPVMRGVIAEAGDLLEQRWRENAVVTSGVHGKHYPNSIEADLVPGVTSIAVDVAPNPGMPQGGMSFEFGSRNQPAHLDGLKALDSVESKVEALVGDALNELFP